MNLPNKLTLLRMAIIPLLIVIYLLMDTIGEMTFILIGILFMLAAITDFFDGYLARKNNIVTTFGKFMDPLADKLLVLGALMLLSHYYTANHLGTLTMWMPFWVVFIILARELLVTSIRLVAVGEGIILHASKFGKYKAAVTMVTIVYYFFIMPLDLRITNTIGIILVAVSVLLTIGSGVDYFLKNKGIILKSI